jgi:hypothetical protein
MHLLNMYHHLILPWKPPVPTSLTATALTHRTPEHRLLRGMSTVVVAMEIEPATECLCATSREGAAEDEDAWVRRWVDGADVRCRVGDRVVKRVR